MTIELEGLSFAVNWENVEDSDKALDSLSSALKKFNQSIGRGSKNVQRQADNIKTLGDAINGVDTSKMDNLVQSLTALGQLSSFKVSAATTKGLERLSTALGTFTDADVERAERIANALTKMGQAGPTPSLKGLKEQKSKETSGDTNPAPPIPPRQQPPRIPIQPPAIPSELESVEEVTLRTETALERVKRRMNEAGSSARQMIGRLSELRNVSGVINGITSSFGKMKSSASSVVGVMSRIGAVGIQQIRNNLGSSIWSATGKMNHFMVALGRIAMYRAFQFIVSQVTQALKEGTTNLYYYSQLMGGTFASSMDNLATSALYLKNSFGAMAGPLIEAVTPAIDFVIGKVVELLNWINQLVARLSGKSSWTRAVRQSKQFGTALSKGVGDGADNARGAVEKLRKSILGFDELNVLQDNDSSGSGGGSGGGGGGGAGTPDYGGMFEEVPFDNAISDFADKLKDAFNRQDWEGLGRLIGAKFNEIVDSIDWYGIGHKLGYGFDAALKVLYFTLDEINWVGLGTHFAELCNGVLDAWDTEYAGRLMAKKLTLVLDMIIGFVDEFDWGRLTQRMSEGFMGFMDEFSDFFEKHDWSQVGNSLWTAIRDAFLGIDFDGITSSFFRLLGNALRAGVFLLGGFLGGIGQDFVDWWNSEIQGANWSETASNLWSAFTSAIGNAGMWAWNSVIDPFCNALLGDEAWNRIKTVGQDIWNNFTSGITSFFSDPLRWIKENMVNPFMDKLLGEETWNDIENLGEDIWNGFCKGLNDFSSNPFQWIKENIVDPFVDKFKSAFGIHSPARVMIEPGKWVGKGILQGILNGIGSIGSWLLEHLIDPMKNFLSNNPLGSLFSWLFGDNDNGGTETEDEINRLKDDNVLDLKINLKKGNFKTVQKWLIPNGSFTAPLKIDFDLSQLDNFETAMMSSIKNTTTLFHSAMNRVFTYINNVIVTVKVSLAKGNYNDVSSWVGSGAVACFVYLIKGNFTTVSEWVGDGRVTCYVDLAKGSGWDTLGNFTGGGGHFSGGGSGGSWDNGSSLTGGIFEPGGFDLGFDEESFQKKMSDSIKHSQAANEAFSSIDIPSIGPFNIPDVEMDISDLNLDIPEIKIPDLSVNFPDINIPKIEPLNIPKLNLDIPSVNIGMPNFNFGSGHIGIPTISSPDYIYIGMPVDTNNATVSTKPFTGGGGSFRGGGSGGTYASGGIPTHGSYFYAGESGPELVGHVGGHTEVMNKFQMASVMYEAVKGGMAGVRIAMPTGFVDSITNSGSAPSETDLSEIESAIISTSERRNDLLREQNELLRDLLHKESKAVITTSEITNALNRKNQRDGKTVVPIG